MSVNIEFKSGYTIEKIVLFDVTGRELKPNFDVNNSNKIVVDISNYSPGVYLLSVQTTS